MYSDLRTIAVEAVRLAVPIAVKIQNKINEIEVIDKSDNSPVTVADYSVQAIISLFLIDRLGSSTFRLVAEETSDYLKTPEGHKCLVEVLSYVNLAFEKDHKTYTEEDILHVLGLSRTNEDQKDNFWVLDPIDGTKGFLRKQYYAIGLAYVSRGQPRIGVIASPNLSFDYSSSYYPVIIDQSVPRGCIFVAESNQGCHMIDMDTNISRCVCTSDQLDLKKCVFVSSYEQKHSNSSVLNDLKAKLKNNEPTILMDSMTKYCLIARGSADCYYRYRSEPDWSENIWDHAAGYIIVKEAGGIVTDIKGEELDFSCGAKLSKNRGILCANPSLYSSILKELESAF